MSQLLLLASEEPNGFLLSSDLNEVIWGSIAFFIVLGLLIKFGGPAVKNGLGGRTERLAKELDDAAAAKAEAQTKLADVQHRIADAGNERQRILDEAATTAASLKAQLQAKADQDASELLARAAADVEASKGQALADLQADAASLALGAAEAVVNRNLDAATQTDLIESYISQVGAQS
ncbi:MAG: F0F1 ATP synthase subunit B [Acidimicrobiales bacterium]